MIDPSWNRIKELFQAAIDRQPDERAAFLERACGSDRALHREVESLLTAHQEAEDFAEQPPIEALARPSHGNRDYDIVSLLGSGGMGEVYRARDVRLGRDVAIKILPHTFSVDPDRLARFDREARLLASLNHPNICAIHGITTVNGTTGLVLELVEGPTLAERIAAEPRDGRRSAAPPVDPSRSLPIGISEALTIARDIAGALEAAHDKGIIHRDLKPANIKITPQGIVKVLDFGLAKLSADSAPGSDRVSEAGMTAAESQDGVLIGTAAYMSPEQALREAIDKRTDIWSFGCVLYEMLSGRRAAHGATISDTIAAVLESEPDWTALPPATPPSVRRLIRRCLEKDVRRRLKDIGDARLELEDALAVASDPGSPSLGGDGRRSTPAVRVWLWTTPVALGLAAILFLAWRSDTAQLSPSELRRVSAQLGTDASLVTFQYGQGSALVLSPDGRMLAFVAQPSDRAPRQLYVRRLDELSAVPITGTEGALNPFFSPDGQWIAYFADGKLKKIPAAGGGAVTICAALNNRGGDWAENGTIVFSPDRAGAALWQVPASGGEARPLIALAEGETTQRWPQLLRGGTAVLFTGNGRPDGFENANVVVQELPDGPRKVLVRGAYYGRYLPSGHLLYVHNETLFAAPFDLRRLELTGAAVPALDGATVLMPVGAAEIAISATGTIAYLPAPEQMNYMHASMDWMDREGKTTPLRTTLARWLHARFAPDGRRVAFDLFDGLQHDIWIYEWSHDSLMRLTFDSASDIVPVWTPDGRRIVFQSTRGYGLIGNLYWQRSDGSGDVERLTNTRRVHVPGSWHPAGRILAFTEIEPETGTPSLMTLRLDGDETSGWRPTQPTVFLKGADDAMFSPDGRWLAYVARTAAQQETEVYVRPFAGPGGPWQISDSGGNSPSWSLTKRELFYATPDHRIVAAPYSVSGDSFHAEKPRLLAETRFAPRVVGRSFDLHPDGERFVLAKATNPGNAADHRHVTLIFNFGDALKKSAPLTR